MNPQMFNSIRAMWVIQSAEALGFMIVWLFLRRFPMFVGEGEVVSHRFSRLRGGLTREVMLRKQAYNELVASLAARGLTAVAARLDWMRNAAGLVDASYWWIEHGKKLFKTTHTSIDA